METFIARRIEEAEELKGQGKEKYSAYFVKTLMYKKYKSDCDAILRTDGYDRCIVEV